MFVVNVRDQINGVENLQVLQFDDIPSENDVRTDRLNVLNEVANSLVHDEMPIGSTLRVWLAETFIGGQRFVGTIEVREFGSKLYPITSVWN